MNKMIDNIKVYFKYLKFYIKNKNKKNIKIKISDEIEGFFKVKLIPSIYLINKYLYYEENFKMTDFKHYSDFFKIAEFF